MTPTYCIENLKVYCQKKSELYTSLYNAKKRHILTRKRSQKRCKIITFALLLLVRSAISLCNTDEKQSKVYFYYHINILDAIMAAATVLTKFFGCRLHGPRGNKPTKVEPPVPHEVTLCVTNFCISTRNAYPGRMTLYAEVPHISNPIALSTLHPAVGLCHVPIDFTFGRPNQRTYGGAGGVSAMSIPAVSFFLQSSDQIDGPSLTNLTNLKGKQNNKTLSGATQTEAQLIECHLTGYYKATSGCVDDHVGPGVKRRREEDDVSDDIGDDSSDDDAYEEFYDDEIDYDDDDIDYSVDAWDDEEEYE